MRQFLFTSSSSHYFDSRIGRTATSVRAALDRRMLGLLVFVISAPTRQNLRVLRLLMPSQTSTIPFTDVTCAGPCTIPILARKHLLLLGRLSLHCTPIRAHSVLFSEAKGLLTCYTNDSTNVLIMFRKAMKYVGIMQDDPRFEYVYNSSSR